MMLGIGLSAPQWEYLMGQLFIANLWLQGACLFVALPWLLVSKRRLRPRAADLLPVSAAGWAPFRDPRLLRGSLGIVLALLVQAMWVAALLSTLAANSSACATYGRYTTECGGMQWIGPAMFLVVLAPGTIAFSTTFHLVALRLVHTAWDANEWTWKMSLQERPALTLVRILRYSPVAWFACFLVGTWLAISPEQRVLALSLIAFMASFFFYGRLKHNKGNQADPQSDSGS